MAKILDGKKLSKKILDDLKEKIKNKRLKLAVILVGDNLVSKIYIQKKKEACQKIGMEFELFKLPLDISQTELEKSVREIVKNPDNSGIVIQLPLPDGIKSQEILNLIPLEKDIDVLSEKSNSSPVFSPVAEAVSRLLKEYNISLEGKKIVLVGAGRLVGRPLSLWLEKKETDFLVVDKNTKNISSLIKKADIIISGVGKPGLITGDMVKKGATVIDAGTSCDECGSVGDVEFESVSEKAEYITPVPGGVGPMTVACLLDNLVKLN